MAFERTESYMHLCAKEVLASWLRSYSSNSAFFVAGDDQIPAPWATNGVWLEYTFASSKYPDAVPFLSWENYFHPSNDSNSFPYEYVKNRTLGLGANWSDCVVADIAIKPNRGLLHLSGWLNGFTSVHHDCCFVFEVVHKHPVSQEKLDTYRRCGVLAVYEVSASWILSQTGVSNTIQCLNVYKLHDVTPLPDCNSVSSTNKSTPIRGDESHDLWGRVVAKVEPQGTRALLLQLGSLVFFDGQVARVAISSRPLFKMAQGRIDNIEQAFLAVTGQKIVVSLEVLPDKKALSAPPAIPVLSSPLALPVSLLRRPGKDVPF